MMELDNGAMWLSQSNHGSHAGKTWVKPIALYGYDAVLSSCRGDDAMQNVSRASDVIIKDRSLFLPLFIKIHLKYTYYKNYTELSTVQNCHYLSEIMIIENAWPSLGSV